MAFLSISGTASIEDTCITSGTPDGNFGNNTFVFHGDNDAWRSLVRVTQAALPNGSVSGFRFFAYEVTAGRVLTGFHVADANDWVEGTSQAGGTQAGSCCWNHAKYDTQSWAGTVGCGTSGTDFDADASPPGLTTQTAVYNEWTLYTAWAMNWKSGARAANGFIIFDGSGAIARKFNSTENAGNQPYFEVDYIATRPLFAMAMRHGGM